MLLNKNTWWLSEDVKDIYLDFEHRMLCKSLETDKQATRIILSRLIKTESELNNIIAESVKEADRIFRQYRRDDRVKKTRNYINITTKQWLNQLSAH